MLAGRMEHFFNVRPDKDRYAPEGVARELQRLNYDTANATGLTSMASILKLLPISQIVFGSDYPYLSTGPQIEELREGGLPSKQRQAILFNNARERSKTTPVQMNSPELKERADVPANVRRQIVNPKTGSSHLEARQVNIGP